MMPTQQEFTILLNLLVELYDVDSGLFIFGRLKLYFGLEDIYLITGLLIDGEPFLADNKLFNKPPTNVKELIGVDYEKNSQGFMVIKSKKVIEFLNSVTDEKDDDEIKRGDRAATLLVLHCFIHQSSGQTDIRSNLVHAVSDIEKLKSYAWGAACWTNIHRTLADCKRDEKKNLRGCVFSLLIFITVRIPAIGKLLFGKNFTMPLSFLLRNAFLQRFDASSFKNAALLLNAQRMLETFKNLNDEEVIKKPYEQIDICGVDMNQLDLRTSICTPICSHFAAYHKPNVALLQYIDNESWADPFRRLSSTLGSRDWVKGKGLSEIVECIARWRMRRETCIISSTRQGISAPTTSNSHGEIRLVSEAPSPPNMNSSSQGCPLLSPLNNINNEVPTTSTGHGEIPLDPEASIPPHVNSSSQGCPPHGNSSWCYF